ncbi:MAG: Rpn family recombination-promoting nuclease/putative transposase [Clostridiales Family XIII bacterium]|jgi:predicted transposase/invertase (TIGR01784 family)|nr:Rpn family recombination-promoting nuclease/putative transposase [Clostridiales Family XIII bacterium]
MKSKIENEIFVPEILPPSEDGVFKTLLMHPDAKPVLRDVIASILNIPVADVTVRNNELPISDIGKKRERFDVNCRTEDGRQIDVEMQTTPMDGDSAATSHKNLKKRAVYYVCDLYASQEGRSTDYGDLMQSFQITFCGFTVFPQREDFVGNFRFRDETGEEFSDAVGIVFVELSKLSAAMKKPVLEMTPAEQWSIFFAYANEPKHGELLREIIMTKEEIGMANEILTGISQDEKERAHYRSRKMYLMDEAHKMAVLRKEIEAGREEGRKEGREEGRKEGREESKAEMARNALAIRLPIEQIQMLTGLSCAEIERLRDAD